ncbi:hypothetical protein LAZ67_18002165 [Cordylochernes scorpioides]|uniref:ATP-dependent DNA helicase n=1 Tax=Cordylochernes scorpioides TaxID=51811 RepID=A0ABY6LGF8_9ARAC|nr:hypothetical protein LAZ67_18002165 [Cordylochernes scorpioides]
MRQKRLKYDEFFKVHVEETTEEKTYECLHCNYATPHRSSIVQHTTVHTGVKPFVCPHCDYKSSQKANLETRETGKYLAECGTCLLIGRDVKVAIASSGIAATLLDGGRTAHSALKLPLNMQMTRYYFVLIYA